MELLKKTTKNNRVNVWFIILALMIVGFLLGVFAKYLDNLPLNNAYILHRLFGSLDLRNVFSRLSIWAIIALIIAVKSTKAWLAAVHVYSFFIGMIVGYYFITINVSGFYPQAEMIRWAIITQVTPIIAWFVWHINSKNQLSMVMSSLVIAFFISQAFSLGFWYIDISYFAEVIILLISLLVVFKKERQILLTSLIAFTVAPIIQWVIPRMLGGF
jgi:hypothetical protein